MIDCGQQLNPSRHLPWHRGARKECISWASRTSFRNDLIRRGSGAYSITRPTLRRVIVVTAPSPTLTANQDSEARRSRSASNALGSDDSPALIETYRGRHAHATRRHARAYRARVSQRVGVLLALPTPDAINHHVLRTTPVDARRISALEGQLAHCCPVAPAVATSERSPEAANPLHKRNLEARPRGFEPLTFGSVASKPNFRLEGANNAPENLACPPETEAAGTSTVSLGATTIASARAT